MQSENVRPEAVGNQLGEDIVKILDSTAIRYSPLRKLISSSRVKPASRNNDIRVPLGRSRLCCGTTARRREDGW